MAKETKQATETHIRILSPADQQEFWQLRLRALKEEPESFEAAYEESITIPESEIAKRLQSSDDAFIFGAFGPDLIAMVGFYRKIGLKIQHKGVIWGMYVAKEHRGNGLGKAIMQAVIDRAEAIAGLEQLHLAVSTHNTAAYNLYQSLGFSSYGIEPHAKKLGQTYTDQHMMMLQLKV